MLASPWSPHSIAVGQGQDLRSRERRVQSAAHKRWRNPIEERGRNAHSDNAKFHHQGSGTMALLALALGYMPWWGWLLLAWCLALAVAFD